MLDTADTRPRWRLAPLWLPMGVLLGTASGAVVGGLMVASWALVDAGSAEDFFEGLAFGGIYGGCVGAPFGLVVGTVQMFCNGNHLPRQRARERAFLVGFCTTGLLCFVVPGALFLFHPIAILVAFVGACLGGGLSYWLASLRPDTRTGL